MLIHWTMAVPARRSVPRVWIAIATIVLSRRERGRRGRGPRRGRPPGRGLGRVEGRRLLPPDHGGPRGPGEDRQQVLHRRWSTRAALVVAALRHHQGGSIENRVPDTGPLRGDVPAVLRLMADRQREIGERTGPRRRPAPPKGMRASVRTADYRDC
ncbi:hypothetical protein SLINC_5784 [Streptomyces lincolnensis]|uniref:Uncharacterized protein n=1 Tax=Streptomyces lincolnensis TaxID=1915 RepID=A0A1B1MHD1_STRLN|nr:hypothetical protein SLINC_5784 [Streptomyces lincolnensis]AXG53786.1 hypothetical protein SLCG_2631 [Streptomyces lincolnensis]